MKPWITLAIGTQKVAAASSVCQADLATSEKFAMAARPERSASLPSWKSESEASKGRQVIRSPAVPASSLELSAALYSVGAEGVNCTLMPGCAASKAGMIWSCQIVRSSLRQLSIVSVTSCAAAMPAARIVEASSSPASRLRFISYSLAGCCPRPRRAGRFDPSECRAEIVPALREYRRRGGRREAPRDQDGRLDRSARLRESVGGGPGAHPGDRLHHRPGAGLQLRVVRDERDHHAVMDGAKPDAHERGHEV